MASLVLHAHVETAPLLAKNGADSRADSTALTIFTSGKASENSARGSPDFKRFKALF